MTLPLTLFLCWLLLWLLCKFCPQARLGHKLILLLCLSPLLIYPFPYSPVWWLRGLTGDLSVLTMCILIAALYQQLWGRELLQQAERKGLEVGIVLLGLCFYPLALGLSNFDPYSLGYTGYILPMTVLCLAAWAYWAGKCGVASMLLLALLAWDLQWLESVNLWDYLLDPFIFFFYLGRLVKRRGLAQ